MNEYSKIGWKNGQAPPISAENLNHMDAAIAEAVKAIINLEQNQATIRSVQLTGNNNYPNIDTAIENNVIYRVFVNSDRTPNGWLIFCGSKYFVDVTVSQFYASRTGEIKYRTGTANNGTVTWDAEWKEISSEGSKDDPYSPPDVEFVSCKDKVEDYLALPDYSSDDYSYSNIPSDITNNHYDRPNGIDVDIPAGSVTIILRDAVTGKEWRETVSGTVHRIENLIPGHLYTYIFLDNSDNAVKTGTCKATGHVRMINGGGNTYNIRDIGGWACDGGRLKYGKIFRGSELNAHVTALTPEQIYLFKDTLDICDEIDLRSDNGAAGITDTALGIGVGYIRVPLPYYTNILSNTVAGNGPELTAQIMHRIIGNLHDGKVSYIHCEAGADRTATVAMLIETVCGVSLSDLDRDYELTSFSFGPSGAQNTRRRSDGTDTTANWKTLIARIKTLEGDTFQDKVIRFLLRCGVSIDELNDLRDCLIDGEPEKLVNPYGNAAITRNLTNIHTENSQDSVVLYQPFETLIIADNMCKIDSLSVTMGGMTVSEYLTHEKLSIPIVTGNIVITGSATQIDTMLGEIEQQLSEI